MAKTPKTPKAKSSTSAKGRKTVEAIRHSAAKRKNIPTAEYGALAGRDVDQPVELRYPRNPNLDPQLVWRGKDQQNWSDLVVNAPSLYIQEKVHPKVLIDDLQRETGERAHEAGEQPIDLFADFNGIPHGVDKTEFYQHDQNWTNRMILGDSLQVMASLAEREGLRGKVQCIYLDPPYGIHFRSNFQWSTSSPKVHDSDKPEEISREPEQVKAFRDTWRDGVHSYLTYLRDRLAVARDLLADTGVIFVQIGSENVHRVRALMDEVFGEGNFVVALAIQKTGSQSGEFIQGNTDTVLWWTKDKAASARKFRPLFLPREGDSSEQSSIERDDFSANPLTSDGFRESTTCPFEFEGRTFHPGKAAHWKVTTDDLGRVGRAGRLIPQDKQIRLKYFYDDYPVMRLGSYWSDVGGATNKVYVVQTSPKVIERCVLMVTDPGDLVLDPTCGAGTTATVAEQWGRRWITIDTSRVALALARARIMGARYPYYVLADTRDGQIKEGEASGRMPSAQPTYGNIRHGFVYQRVPHVTLTSIANNTEIDVIWDKWQATLEPLRAKLDAALNHRWEEWEIPREPDSGWSAEARKLHTHWWQARIARQQESDASIAAKAEFECLFDKPYEDKKRVRVAGPFTVESLSPHRMLGVDENDELIDQAAEKPEEYAGRQTFAQLILENLRVAGVQQAHKEDRITFTSLTPYVGRLICGQGTYQEGNKDRTAGIFIGPEFGTVQRADLVEAAKEAGDVGFDVLIACAFAYEAHTTEFSKLGRLPVLKARMNADLHMAEDLKATGKGNLFVIFGEPDIELIERKDGKLQVQVKGVDVFKPQTGEVESSNTDGIACWFLDTDYNEESFFVRHAYFLGANDPYGSLKTTLKAEIDQDAWESLHSDTSRPFGRPRSNRIAVKVINHLGDEVMKVFRV